MYRICLWGAVTTATRARNTCNNAETVTEALIFVHLSLSTIKRSGNESSIITDTQFLHLCNLDLFWDNRSTFCCRVKKMVLNQNWENEYTVHSVDICILFSCSDWLLQFCSAACVGPGDTAELHPMLHSDFCFKMHFSRMHDQTLLLFLNKFYQSTLRTNETRSASRLK